MPKDRELEEIIAKSIKEDKALFDITSDLLIKENSIIDFTISARQSLVFCGSGVAQKVFSNLQSNSKFAAAKIDLKELVSDGDHVKSGQVMIKGKGDARLIFAGERIILNLIQHLSSISTKVSLLKEKLANPKIQILDTRKSIPGYRYLQKYAVKVGGGANHRFNLSDLILIKDNHIAAAGGVKNVFALIEANKPNIKIEIECDHTYQVQESCNHKPDIIMLDNMNPEQLKDSIEFIRNNSSAKIEISGNVNIGNINNYSNLDIDFISIGSLTNSIDIVDIGLDTTLKTV